MVSQFQILNKILQNKDYSLIDLNGLSEDFFFNYKAEFNYIKDHYSMYHCVPDRLTFKSVFNDFKIQDVGEPDSYLIEELFRDYNQAYLAERFTKMRDKLEANQVEDAMQYFKDSLEGLRIGSALTCIDLTEDFSRFDHYKEKLVDQTSYYISTGLAELDALMGGIDIKNENMVIAARTGVGKSWILLMMAAAAYRQGKCVGIYSGEMHEDKVGYRIDTILGGISNKAMNRGYANIESMYTDYIKKLAAVGTSGGLDDVAPGGHIKVITPSMIAGSPTVDVLRSFIEKEHLDILFIDQYSLLEDTSKARQLYERVGNISKSIKMLQVMKQIPIVSVTQMNRNGQSKDGEEEKEQDTTQIGLADRIGQDATSIIMLSKLPIDPDTNKPVKKMESGKTYTKFIFTLNTVKSRDGGEGKLSYIVDLDTFDCVFSDTTSKNRDYESDEIEHSDSDDYLVPAPTRMDSMVTEI